MGVRIVVAEGEPIGLALRRFNKHVSRQGLMLELRSRAYFIERTEVRRAKQFRKRFKSREATFLAQRAGEQPVESLDEALAEFWRRTGKP